jgi:L-threonylcarbamoyladenylate synthase
MINTLILKITGDKEDEEKIEQAAQELRRGGLVAFPTETVYGLGGNGLDPHVVDKIYKAKGRPSDNPMILHISSREEIDPLVSEIPPIAEKIMSAFWPGPLTFIFNKSSIVPEKVTGGLNTVAIRMPSHPLAKKLIEKSGMPIAAPSANLSGKPSPTKAKHVIQDLMGRVEIILKEKQSTIGLESTVLDITSPIPVILRPGGITYQQIKELIGKVEIDKGIMEDRKKDFKPKAPGMKYTHYAPNAPMTIIQGPRWKVIDKINEMADDYTAQGKHIGILAVQENLEYYSKGTIMSAGSRDKPESIAANLFDLLRQFDEEKVDVILAEGIEGQGIEMAIINRMNKAAGHKIIYV